MEEGQDQPVEETEDHASEMPGEFLLWLWDAFDLAVFVLWTWLYKDHVSNDDRSSFLIVSLCVVLPGFYLLLRAVYNAALEKANQKCPICGYFIMHLAPLLLISLPMLAEETIPIWKSYLDGADDGLDSFFAWITSIEYDGVYNLTTTYEGVCSLLLPMYENCTTISRYMNVTTGITQERHINYHGDAVFGFWINSTDVGTDQASWVGECAGMWTSFKASLTFKEPSVPSCVKLFDIPEKHQAVSVIWTSVLVGFLIALYAARIDKLLGQTAKVNLWRVSKGYEKFPMISVIMCWFYGKSLFGLTRHLDIIRRKQIDPGLEEAARYLTLAPLQPEHILQQEYSNWELENDKRRRSRHIYAEILYDVIQTAVMTWVMSEVELKDKHFPFKLLLDFVNMATTCGDLFLLKGPEAFNMLLENAGAEGFGKALLEELRAYGSDGDEKNMYPTAMEGLKVTVGGNFSTWRNQTYRGKCLVATLLPGLDEWIRFSLLEATVKTPETEPLSGPKDP